MLILRESTVMAGVVFFLLFVFAGFCLAEGTEDVPAEGKKITSIETAGNVSIFRAKILAQVRARAGEKFNKASAEEDAERIGKLDGVKYAYYNTVVTGDAVKLTYIVIEKNLIRLLNFNGNTAFKDAKLRKKTGLKKGDYLDLFIVRDSVKSLLDYYHKKGFAKVKIELAEDQLDKGEVVYNISEGNRIKIQKITFTGNETLSGKELAKAIDTKKRKYIFWRGYFNSEVIEEDIAKLEEVYQKRGFLNVAVFAKVELTEDGKGALVTFTIDEGGIFYISEISITGNEFFDTSVLTETLRLKTGGIYSKEYGDFDAGKILTRYLEAGFVDATVEHRRLFSGTDKSLSVVFDIFEGERFRIGKISITGNDEVHGNVIRRVLEEEDFVPGRWYNADMARGNGTGELERFVQRKVMAESVVIRMEPNDRTPGKRDAQVNISESQTGSIMLGVGVASNSGLIGQVVYDQRNFDIFDVPESFSEFITGRAFKGAGQRLRISLSPGTRRSAFSVSFTEPYLYDKPVQLDMIASSYERRQISHKKKIFDEKRLKGHIGLEKRYQNDWRRGFSFRAENVNIHDLAPDVPVEIKKVKGGTSLYGLRLYIRRDTTDSRFLPSEGYNFTAGYEQVGGDFTFGVINATQRWYKTLYEDLGGRKTVLETKIQSGTIVGEAPMFEKFYAGGTGSIRGFDYRGVSTRGLSTGPGTPEYRDPIGSDWILTGNAEIAVPITTEVLSWLFFVDAGAIDSGRVRSSVGTGIQILLPQWFGPVPMRFELAAPITKEDVDETKVFSFTIGALF
ncbi:MAG: BamA/TamA family outer membrane protein [Planctomycetes bacterium]|nr:BamA/TamA family outer membrane protein [Planctomycetota bacterium]